MTDDLLGFEYDGELKLEAGSGIAPEELVPGPEDLRGSRRYCPHDCGWWVPEGREQLALRHTCAVVEGVYDGLPSGLLDAEGMDPTEYVSHFIGSDEQLDLGELLDDLAPRPRSQRVELLFGFTPIDYQRAILDCPEPDQSVNNARQVGKTETLGVFAADAALFEAAPNGYDVMFAGDVHDTAVEMYRRCKKHINKCPIPNELLGFESDPNKTYAEFADGERIMTGSLKDGGDNERGVLPQTVCVDEAALVERVAIEEVIEPMFATHGEDHHLLISSTPRGTAGIHYDANTPGAAPDHFAVHSVPTWGNPYVSSAFLAKKHASTDTLTWRQEWLGEFVERGAVYIPTKLYARCQGELELEAHRKGVPHPDQEYFMGVDVARKGTDRTVFVVLAENGDVPLIESEAQSSIPGVVRRMGDLHDRWDFARVLVDENTFGGGVVDFAQETPSMAPFVEGIPFSTPRKAAMYRNLKKTFELEDLRLPKHTSMLTETTSLTFDYTKTGHLQVDHPSNGNDDHPDALALACFARGTTALVVPPEATRPHYA